MDLYVSVYIFDLHSRTATNSGELNSLQSNWQSLWLSDEVKEQVDPRTPAGHRVGQAFSTGVVSPIQALVKDSPLRAKRLYSEAWAGTDSAPVHQPRATPRRSSAVRWVVWYSVNAPLPGLSLAAFRVAVKALDSVLMYVISGHLARSWDASGLFVRPYVLYGSQQLFCVQAVAQRQKR